MSDFQQVLLLLASVRATVALGVVPFFASSGQGGLPQRALIIANLAVVLPLLLPTLDSEWPKDPVVLAVLALKEGFIGAVLGFGAGLVVWALESAGELIDLQRGSTVAGVLNPFFGAVNSPIGGLFSRLAVAVFYATGMYLAFFGVLLSSYSVFPLFEFLPAPSVGGLEVFLGEMSHYFRLTLLYAAPVLLIFFLIDVGLGFVNRFVPSLNVFFLSMPLKSAVGFFVLIPFVGILMTSFASENLNGARLTEFLKAVLR